LEEAKGNPARRAEIRSTLRTARRRFLYVVVFRDLSQWLCLGKAERNKMACSTVVTAGLHVKKKKKKVRHDAVIFTAVHFRP
jgi:hypothetical protein